MTLSDLLVFSLSVINLQIPNLLTNENLFLIFLGLIWIIGSIIQDLKRREVDNIWNFSLIAFALAYRFSVFIFGGNFWFFVNGLLGLLVFLILGNIFYYSKLFAGGDAKLLIALGTVLPLSYNWLINFKIFVVFLFLFLAGGAVYVFIWSLFLAFFNWNKFCKEFIKQFKIYKNVFLVFFAVFLLLILVNFIIYKFGDRFLLFLIGLPILLFPVLWIYSKSVEESCLVKLADAKELIEGDWLYEDVYIKNSKVGKSLKIEKSWHGVSKEEIALLKKHKKKVLVKYGIPFTPGFLIGFLGILWLSWF